MRQTNALLWRLSLVVFGMTLASAQESPVTLGIGVGLPEFVNLSVRYRPTLRSQLGITVGGFPYAESALVASVDLEHYLHIGRIADERPPWFLRTGLSYMYDDGPFDRTSVLALKLAAGHETRLTEYIGCSVDGGFAIALARWDVEKRQHAPFQFDLRPIDVGAVVLRVQLFSYRWE
jgi:hypothetical protein